MAWATVLINISHLAFDINYSFHPITQFVIFSCSSLKVFTFDLPLLIGKPKYFSQSIITFAPNNCWIAFLTFGFVFLLKNNVVFCLLIDCPDAASYFPKRVVSLWHSFTVARQNKRLSSANNRWDNEKLPSQYPIFFKWLQSKGNNRI